MALATEGVDPVAAPAGPPPGPAAPTRPCLPRVLLVDPNDRLRGRLAQVLALHGVTVVGEAADQAGAVRLAGERRPTVAVVDLRAAPNVQGLGIRAVSGGLGLVKALCGVSSGPQVLVHSALGTPGGEPALEAVLRAAGAFGLVPKGMFESRVLLEAILRAHAAWMRTPVP